MVGMAICLAAGITLVGMSQPWWAALPMGLSVLFAGMAMYRDSKKEDE